MFIEEGLKYKRSMLLFVVSSNFNVNSVLARIQLLDNSKIHGSARCSLGNLRPLLFVCRVMSDISKQDCEHNKQIP